jgi:hypothetical protein
VENKISKNSLNVSSGCTKYALKIIKVIVCADKTMLNKLHCAQNTETKKRKI